MDWQVCALGATMHMAASPNHTQTH